MLIAGDRALVRVQDDIQTWHVCQDHKGKLWDKVAERDGKQYRVWFDGRNYRVGRHVVVARV